MGLGRWIAGATVAGGVAVFAGTGAFDDGTTRNDAGQIEEAGGLGAFVLRVGDCVQLPDEMEVVSVEGVPCSTPHDAEVYARFDLPELDSFDADEVGALSDEGCFDRWSDAIGTVYEDDPDLDYTLLEPTAESWTEGDREVSCLVTSVDGDPLTGSQLRPA
jgi:hypothetical protein